MTGRTHLTLGAAAGLLIAAHTGADPLWCVAAGTIGGLLPDIDHPGSMITGWLPGSWILRLGTRHRGFTHSAAALALLVAAWLTAGSPFPAVFASFIAGTVSHIVADMLTPAGVRLLWPLPGNFKALPGLFLRGANFFGLEMVVWLVGVAALAAGAWLLMT